MQLALLSSIMSRIIAAGGGGGACADYTAPTMGSITNVTEIETGIAANGVELHVCNLVLDSASDPYRDNVMALLRLDGADGTTDMVDETGRTWTVVGAAQLDTAQARFGTSSLLLDGDLDYATTVASADLAFGVGDFTVECWFRPSVSQSGNRFLFDFRVAGGESFVVWCSQTGNPNALGYSTHIGASFIAGGSFTVGAWNHVAVVRAGTTVRGFINGAQVFTTTDSRDFGSSQGLYLGSSVTANQGAIGHLDVVRITKGVARYTSAFTVRQQQFPKV